MKAKPADGRSSANTADEDLRWHAGGRQTDEIFRVVVEAAPNAMVLADSQGRILLVNTGTEKLFGYTRGELTGQPVEMLVPERFRGSHPGYRASYVANAEARPMGHGRDLFALRKDGSEVPVEIGLSPMLTREGPLVLSVIVDITARKKAEEARHFAEADFRASFYSSAVGQAQVDPATCKYLRVNPRFCEIVGYSEDELLRMTFHDLTHPDDRADDSTAHDRMVRGETPGVSHEKRYLRKDGRTVWVDVNASLIRDEADRPLRTLAVVQDITARKQAEEARRSAEARYQRLVEQSLTGIYVVQDDRFVYVNPKLAEILGYSQAELTSAFVTGFILEEDRPLVRENIRERLGGAVESIRYGLRMLRKDGSVIHVEIHGGRSEYNGRPAILGTLLDVSERKAAEAESERSHRELQFILDAVPALVFYKDREGRFLRVNRELARLMGVPPEAFVGKTDTGMGSPDGERYRADDLRVMTSGKPIRGLEEQLHTAGGIRWLLTDKLPHLDESGHITGVIGFAVDITERKQAEESLQALNADLERRVQERTAELESLFESLPGLYLVLTPDLMIVAASDAYLTATMTTRESIVGRGLFAVFPDNPDDPAATGASNLRASLDRVRRNAAPDTMAIQKYDVRRPDGVFEERYWSPINSPVFGADRQIKYIVHRVEEVTEFVLQKSQQGGDSAELRARVEQMQAEIFQNSQKLQEANRQLEAANKELESFSYSVSHDLRAPLRAMDGFSQAVVEDYGPQLPEEGRRYLQIIREGAQRMGRLIDDLLTFSRLSRAPLTKQEVNTGQLVRGVLEDLSSQREGRRIDLRMGELPACAGDPALLKQVWINLLSNALKYTQKREVAVVEIGCEPKPGGNVYFVRDNGAGFDMRYSGKLFGVFHRLHRADEYEGTGVGLAIVQRVIHRHGGRVWADAAVDQGANFYFTLEEATKP